MPASPSCAALAPSRRVDAIVGIARRLPAWRTRDDLVASRRPQPRPRSSRCWRRRRRRPPRRGSIEPSRDRRRRRATQRRGHRASSTPLAACRRGRARLRVLGRRVRARPQGPRWSTSPGRRRASRRRSTRATRPTVERRARRLERAHPRLRVVRLRPGLIFQRDAAHRASGACSPARCCPRALRAPRRWCRWCRATRALRVQAVHADDVADAYRRAILARRRSRRLQRRGRAGRSTARRSAARSARAPVPVPRAVLRAAAALTWRARLQPTAPGWLDLALGVPLMDCARARRELGWTPRAAPTEAFRELFDGPARAGAGATDAAARPAARAARRASHEPAPGVRRPEPLTHEPGCVACDRLQTMAQEHLDRLTAIDASFLAPGGPDVAHARRRA